VRNTPVGLPLTVGGPGVDLEHAELAGGERGLLVGVVLLAGEHPVEQRGEHARDAAAETCATSIQL
jgi:hypothetical protein